MGRSARVTSIDVLPLLAAALQKFRSEGVGALDDLESEVRRALEWIHHDRKEYWAHELHRAQEALTQARLQLQQAMTMRRVADRQPSCTDEKRAVDRAKRRLETAQRKSEAVRHWSAALDRAVDDFRKSRTQCATWLDIDISRAAAALNKLSESLVTYISMKASDEPPPGDRPNGPVSEKGTVPLGTPAPDAPPAGAEKKGIGP